MQYLAKLKFDFFKYQFTKQSPFNYGSQVSQSENQKSFPLQDYQFRESFEIKLPQKLFMSANKEVFKFLTIFCFLVNFFYIHVKCMFAFLYNAASFIPIIKIFVCQCNLFWDCAYGFANIFEVHNDFNTTINFIRFLNSTNSFADVNLGVSCNGNCNFSELINKLKPGSSGSNKNAIVIFIFFDTFLFR